MKEGQILKDFIDHQHLSKTSIAQSMGMSKQNLYQLFKSYMLEQETKKRFESFFKKPIFNISNPKDVSEPVICQNHAPLETDYKEKYIALLESQVQRNDQIMNLLIEIKHLITEKGIADK